MKSRVGCLSKTKELWCKARRPVTVHKCTQNLLDNSHVMCASVIHDWDKYRDQTSLTGSKKYMLYTILYIPILRILSICRIDASCRNDDRFLVLETLRWQHYCWGNSLWKSVVSCSLLHYDLSSSQLFSFLFASYTFLLLIQWNTIFTFCGIQVFC